MPGIALVTGASRGIGAATARLLGARGYAVAVNHRDSADKADEVVRAIAAAGGRAVAVQADTGVEADILRLFDTVDRELGTPTHLVCNAAVIGRRGRLDALPAADIERTLAINVMGYMLCCREAVRRMSTKHGGKGGAIVLVSSGSAHLGQPNAALYSVTKGATNSLLVSLAQEVGAEGIRVNAVMPGMTRTDMPDAASFERALPNIPMGRIGEPEEIAEAIAWLLSDAASYTSGANIRVSGGRL